MDPAGKELVKNLGPLALLVIGAIVAVLVLAKLPSWFWILIVAVGAYSVTRWIKAGGSSLP